jgi:hypothetical protein
MTTTVRGILSHLPRPLAATALVFPNTVGNRDLRWAQKTVSAAFRSAKIDDFRFHDLRTLLRPGSPWKVWIYSRSRNSVAGRVSPWFSGMPISHRLIGAQPLSAL